MTTDYQKKLEKISPAERKMLQALAVFWETTTVNDFQKLLRQLDLRTRDGKFYSIPYISQIRKALVQKGVLENKQEFWGSGFQIAGNGLREFLTREAARADDFAELLRIINKNFNLSEFSVWYKGERYNNRLLRDYRLSVYAKDRKEMDRLLGLIANRELSVGRILVSIFSDPFQSEFYGEFDKKFRGDFLPILIDHAVDSGQPTDVFWEFADRHGLSDLPMVRLRRTNDLIFRGELDRAARSIGEPQNVGQFMALGTIAFLRAKFADAAGFYDEAVKIWRSALRKRKGFPPVWQMFLYGLALFRTSEAKFYDFAAKFSEFCLKHDDEKDAARALDAVAYFLKNDDKSAAASYALIGSATLAQKFLQVLVAAIVPDLKTPEFAADFEKQARTLGYRWIEAETANLFAVRGRTGAESAERAAVLRAELGFEPVGNIVPRLEDWERALNVLQLVAEKTPGKTDAPAKIDETRVAWLLDFGRREIQPVEQKYGKKGWTDGRNIALKRLFERDVRNLTDQDSLVIKNALTKNSDYYYYGAVQYEFDWEAAISALAGHPYLFLLSNPSVGLQLTEAEPTLVIRERGDALELSFDTKFSGEGIVVAKETETRYRIVKVTKDHVEIANSLKNNRLRVPAAGRDRLLKAIRPLSTRLAIESDLEEHFENLPAVDADKRIHALVTPAGEGFHLEFFVKPFGRIPPYFKPGKGTETVIAELDGVRTRTRRDLPHERRLLAEIEEACPFLAGFESPNYEWSLADAQNCLTALSELETPRRDGKLTVEWPKGQKIKLLGNISFDNFSLSVKEKNNWFEVEGKAAVNEELVLSLRELNKILSAGDKAFYELSDGQFVAITEKLRKHLLSLGAVVDDKNRFHALRGGVIEEIAADLDHFKADRAWKAHLEKIKKAAAFTPEVPTTFEAELRPYQVEGYNWLARLAEWGVGACLADDMGLGKTVIALALLVERAERGAALVVAPVSVCRNWLKEARRFAPTLNFKLFGAGDRRAQVESLGKYDVLVTSYSLLQSEEELFTGRDFATIVLDEAQAVKNRHTKRSKTVMSLRGDFRLLTTGTPIENHLGELWNLFNFINPGLLGSHDFFTAKFAVPIEKDKNETARRTLHRLIRPFVLRRRKNQVLDDLPAKTEIMLTVELSAEERAFYETVRREALERIEADDGATPDKRFRILGELTRLRLACCHPKLVNENVPLGSSKLELFGETLDELLENKHKALVFSQFVKHLQIVRHYLDKKKIAYQYLDGSTPPEQRQQRIDEFQRGAGDVFLISLKAGGTGLNLTAADYVIHLDPWWNPAVEDQATDRAHRIGQQRPVTVYRLVTEDTVEEKILRLHETKRDLADSLLAETDTSGKLSAEDLLALISEA